MDQLKIGTFLQTLRKAKGLTQAELAEVFDVSNKTVSKWECGESVPEVPVLKALAEYYGITVDEILNGERSKADISEEMKANEDFLVEKRFSKLKMFYLISFSVLFFSATLYVLFTYLVTRQDFGSIIPLCIAVSAFIPLCIGLMLHGGKVYYFNQYGRIRDYIFIATGAFITLMGVLIFGYMYSYSEVVKAGLSVSHYYLNFHALIGPLGIAALVGLSLFGMYLFIYKLAVSDSQPEFLQKTGRFLNLTSLHVHFVSLGYLIYCICFCGYSDGIYLIQIIGIAIATILLIIFIKKEIVKVWIIGALCLLASVFGFLFDLIMLIFAGIYLLFFILHLVIHIKKKNGKEEKAE